MDLFTKLIKFEGSIIYPDQRKANWLKVDGILTGESNIFTTKRTTTNDIGKLLDRCFEDTEVMTVAVSWKTGDVLIRNGFDLSDSNDSQSDPDFTTFIIRQRVQSRYVETNTGDKAASSDCVGNTNSNKKLIGQSIKGSTFYIQFIDC